MQLLMSFLLTHVYLDLKGDSYHFYSDLYFVSLESTINQKRTFEIGKVRPLWWLCNVSSICDLYFV